LKQRPRLKQLGQSTKKGLLFHGPPGNGKTHTIHYLIGAACGHTTLLISAEQVAKLSEYITLARLLQPSIVILEDVDLIARARSSMSSPCEETMLNKLLNEMDGLREDAEILFILTTNQPSALEEALAARPGRVDQAIEFPPPDALGREKLARLYSQQMQLDSHVLARIVDQTENVSAVFIKELMRRSLQYRLSRSDSTAIQIEDVQSSLEEMLLGASSLNHRVLGFGRNTVVDGRPIDIAADV
jgi:ATP-dependent 26S proteasome regulatory subunit